MTPEQTGEAERQADRPRDAQPNRRPRVGDYLVLRESKDGDRLVGRAFAKLEDAVANADRWHARRPHREVIVFQLGHPVWRALGNGKAEDKKI
jgi:hypothetical protein